MPRQSRIDVPGALHHIIVRGIERRKIFNDDQDRNNFLERMGTIIEHFERQYALKAKGVDLVTTAARAAELLGIKTDRVWQAGKSRLQVKALSLLCYWAMRELGERMTDMSRRLGISTPAVSKSVICGTEISKKEEVSFFSKFKSKGRP
jgi:DNA-binding transcriptional regulator YdaS (Cro superfamily)